MSQNTLHFGVAVDVKKYPYTQVVQSVMLFRHAAQGEVHVSQVSVEVS